jgi:predicted nucleic acid-binding protein
MLTVWHPPDARSTCELHPFRRAGTPLAELDLQIVSIALTHALPLATHNTGHFERIPGLTLVERLAGR